MNSTTAIVDASADLEAIPPNGYRALCIIDLTLCLISVILCVVLVAATTLPLLYPKRRTNYSTYNLYLAYMAIPDLAANAFIVYLLLNHNNWVLFKSYEKETPDDGSLLWMFDHPFDHNVFILCVTGNLYVNAFLALELYRLLKNSKIRKRHYPPSIWRVSKQAMISYGLGFFIFLLEYWVSEPLKRSNSTWKILYQVFTVIFVGIIPLSVLTYVCAMIYKQGLVKSTGSMYEGRLKVLVVYFARIVFTGLLIWLPACLIYLASWRLEEVNATKVLAYHTAIVFSGTQPIVSFGFSLTKPDARKLIFDLLKGVYCCRCCYEDKEGMGGCCERVVDDGQGNSSNDNCNFDDPYLRSCLPTTVFSSIYRTSIFSKQSSGRKSQETNTIEDWQKSQSNTTTNEATESPDPQSGSNTNLASEEA